MPLLCCNDTMRTVIVLTLTLMMALAYKMRFASAVVLYCSTYVKHSQVR